MQENGVGALNRPKVLLVDDDASIRKIYCDVLEHTGYEIIEATNYDQAIALVDASIDIALLDIMLPGKSGLEVLGHIHKQYPLCPVIMISAYADKRNAIDALHKGAADYLEKPINMDELKHVVARLLSYRALSEENTCLHEEKKLQNELRESEQRFRGVFECGAGGVVVASLDGTFLQVNQYFCKMLGYSEEELLSKTFMDITHPDDLEKEMPDYEKTLVGELSRVSFEKRYIDKNGDIVWILIGVSVLSDQAGKPECFVGLVQNISERKQAEQAKRDSEARFTTILTNAYEAIIVVNQDQCIQVFNKGAEKVFGYESSEVLGKALDILIPEAANKVHREHVNEFIAGQDTVRPMHGYREIQAQRKDGTVFIAEATISKIYTAEGMVLTAMLRDATERKQVEAALLQSEQLYHNIVKASMDAIISVDTKGTITTVSQGAESMFGYSKDEMHGIFFVKLIPEESLEEARQLLGQVKKTGFIKGIITQRKRKDGTLIDVEITLTAMGKAGHLVVVRDITERKLAEEKRVESERRLQSIMDNTTSVIYLKGAEGRYILVNQQFEELFHLKKGEMVGKLDHDIFPEDMANAFRQNDLDVLAAGKAVESEEYAPHDDGIHTYLSIKFPIYDNKGNVCGTGGISTDITERKLAETEKTRLATAIEYAAEAISVEDSEARILYANPAFERLSGFTQEEILGQFSSLLRSDQHSKSFYKGMCDTVSAGKVWKGEVFIKRKDGGLCEVERCIAPTFDSEGGIINHIVMQRDITERRKAESDLRERTEKQERFNKIAVGREIQMIELKQEINALLEELKREKKYTIHAPIAKQDKGQEE